MVSVQAHGSALQNEFQKGILVIASTYEQIRWFDIEVTTKVCTRRPWEVSVKGGSYVYEESS